MFTKRIIPCLDVNNGRVVKGVNFVNLQDAGDPVEIAKAYDKDVYKRQHISGIDLVQAKDGQWYVLEDNLRVPSGASYPMIVRELCRRCSPRTFQQTRIDDNRNYAQLLRKTLDHVNVGGHCVILTPGRYNEMCIRDRSHSEPP